MSTLLIPMRTPPPSPAPKCEALINPFEIVVMYMTYSHFPAANLIKLIDPEDDDTNAPSKYLLIDGRKATTDVNLR